MCKLYIPVNDRVHEFGTWQNGAMYYAISDSSQNIELISNVYTYPISK